MSIPKRPDIGECIQFWRTTDEANVVTAGRVTGYDPESRRGLVIDYAHPEKGVIRGAQISVFDLISDEDVVIHDLDA